MEGLINGQAVVKPVIFQIPKRFIEKVDIWFAFNDVIVSACFRVLAFQSWKIQ